MSENLINQGTKEPKEIFEKKLFWRYGREHLEEMRLLFRGGRLSRKEGDWNNVIVHCLAEGAVADVLGDMLDLSEEEKVELQKASLCHDWKKRLDIKPGDFTTEQRKKAEKLLQQVNPRADIISATYPGFSKEILDGRASFLQELQYYIDDIVSGGKIVGWQERIDEVEKRTKFNDDPEWTSKLGGRFWDIERAASQKVEQKLFQILKEKGIALDSPEDISKIIRRKVMEIIDSEQDKK